MTYAVRACLAVEPDAATEAIIEQGHEVGMLARQMFPGGVEVNCSCGLADAIRVTLNLVANREVQAIYEAVFEHQDLLVKVDILHRRRDGRWRIIEVKSTTNIKDHHLEDVAIQYRVNSPLRLKYRPKRGNHENSSAAQKQYKISGIQRKRLENRGKRMAPQVGLEPTTLRLTAGCSAIELLRSVRVGR